MGIIMAVGVAESNAILFVTNAQKHKKMNNPQPFLKGASGRLRPILMTTVAMVAGMIPMAIGLGRGGDQTAPLGVAVIGGLLFSAFGTLVFLPIIYANVSGKNPYQNPSLDPEDVNSSHYEEVG